MSDSTEESNEAFRSLMDVVDVEILSQPDTVAPFTDKNFYAFDKRNNKHILPSPNNPDILEYDEIFEFPRNELSKGKRFEVASTIIVKYKGADWSNLIVYAISKDCLNKFSIFIGFENGLSLPDGWVGTISCTWELLNSDSSEILKTGKLYIIFYILLSNNQS